MKEATGAADAVRGADVVITMLPGAKHVLGCYSGSDGSPGIVNAPKPGTLFIDCSTIDVSASREAFATYDQKEGMAAFLEKRTPSFDRDPE